MDSSMQYRKVTLTHWNGCHHGPVMVASAVPPQVFSKQRTDDVRCGLPLGWRQQKSALKNDGNQWSRVNGTGAIATCRVPRG